MFRGNHHFRLDWHIWCSAKLADSRCSGGKGCSTGFLGSCHHLLGWVIPYGCQVAECENMKCVLDMNLVIPRVHRPLARYIRLRVARAPGMPGTFSPPLRVRHSTMHHSTCVTHVPWWMPGSLTNGYLWSRWRGKCTRHSRRMRNPRFHISNKRPLVETHQQIQHSLDSSSPFTGSPNKTIQNGRRDLTM